MAKISNDYLLSLIVLGLSLALLAWIFFGKDTETSELIRMSAFCIVASVFAGSGYLIFQLSLTSSEKVPETIDVAREEDDAANEYVLRSFDIAYGLNVEVGPIPDLYGGDVLMNAAPFNDRPNMAGFRFDAKAGSYILFVRYASAAPRPFSVVVNGEVQIEEACREATSGWLQKDQVWQQCGTVVLQEGANTIELRRGAPFPHITQLRLSSE